MNWGFDPSDLPDAPFERARMLQDMLVARATGGAMDEYLYLCRPGDKAIAADLLGRPRGKGDHCVVDVAETGGCLTEAP